MKGQEDRDYLLKELQGDAEKAGKAGNAVLRAAPAAVGGLDPGAGLTAVRRDLYLSLLDKPHADYHSRDTGEYLSWLTNNVRQIENLAWTK